MIKEIKQGESKILEFKEKIDRHINVVKTLCAFANRSGGKLIIGINDEGEIEGLDNIEIEDYLEKLPNIIVDSIRPLMLPEIYTFEIEGKILLVIEVRPGQNTPYYIKSKGMRDGTYVRIGRTNKLADQEMITDLHRKKLNISYDMDIFKECDDKDINRMIDLLCEELNMDITLEKLMTLGLVKQEGAIYYLTNGGAIITGELEQSVLKCARFIGDTSYEFMDRKEYSGNLFEQIKHATNFIVSHLQVAGYFVEGDLRRHDELEIPYNIVREAVINSVLHRDYNMSGADIKIGIYNSYIDIISPGGLPGTITIDEIYKGRSEIRNKTLAKVLLRANLIEQWGSGIPRIRNACYLKGYILPELFEDGMFTTLRIYRKSTDNNRIREIKASYGDNSSPDDNFEALIEVVEENNRVTVKELSVRLGMSTSTVQRKLKKLQEDGRIRRVGAKKNGYWMINNCYLLEQ